MRKIVAALVCAGTMTGSIAARDQAASALPSTWALSTTATIGTNHLLNGVSCVGPSSCTAVGSAITSQGYHPIAEHWDGTIWSAALVPAVGAYSTLNSVSCTDVSMCIAVGSEGISPSRPLAERWNGSSWSVLPIAAPMGQSDVELWGVSCVSATFV